MNIEKLIKEMTIEEKAALLSGTDFMHTNPIPRLNIPSLCMADGPHGLRKQVGSADNGISKSEPSTAFPTAATVASGWNTENARRMGEAIGDECRHYGVNILLGPGVNIKRNPLCGRNFEYFSEDPYLTGEMGTAFTKGVQSRNIGVSVKHFAANNSENYRFMGESVVDERALREIYLKAFEKIVKTAKPYTLMCAYNGLSGIPCSQNKDLLTNILRTEWGFDGVVMTDWGAAKDRVKGVEAGLDLEMPGDTAYCRKSIIDAVNNHSLHEQDLNKAVRNILELVERCNEQKPLHSLPIDEHHKLAGEIAKDSAVLLKNDGLLPLNAGNKLLIVGDMFTKMRYQGAGSSMINPTKLTTPKDAFHKHNISYVFAEGYKENSYEIMPELINEIKSVKSDYNTVIFFGGLTDYAESEGGDRDNLLLPPNQLAVIDELINTGKPVIVVLFGGSPMELPFADKVNAILNMYLPGQNAGEAVAALLLGEANPCGKLAESWPLSYLDVPFAKDYSKSPVELYKESIFVGYRYYITAKKPVRYAFGHGLSYSTFEYSNLKITTENKEITVTCDITNTGDYYGGEIVQLYVKNNHSKVFKPYRELRAFHKLYLNSGETKEAKLCFQESDISYFNYKHNDLVVENGIYTVEIGASCEDIRLQCDIEIINSKSCDSPYSKEVTHCYMNLRNFEVPDLIFEKLINRKLPKPLPTLPLHMESKFSDFNQRFMGRILYKAIMSVAYNLYSRIL